MATFTVTIKLGNAEMRTGGNVAEALREVADRLDTYWLFDEIGGWDGLSGGIMDINGNTVGRWEARR